MRDQAIWSVSLGRWGGVQVRLHMFFLLFAAFTLYLSWLYGQTADAPGILGCSLACLVILLLSVLVHELSHVVAAYRLGVTTDEIVLGPLGGLGHTPLSLEPPSEWLAVAAGPLANLGICFLAALCLALQGDANLVGLMNPLSPTNVLEGLPLAVGLKLTFWINWLLVLLNLIPAYPFDGGRALRAALLVIRPRLEPQRAVMIVAAVAKLIALGLLIVAWLVRSDSLDYVVQSWFALVLLAVFVFFSARKAESMAAAMGQEEAFLGYDFSEGYTSLERSGPKTFTKPHIGPLVRWWQRRRELREQKQRELEAFEDCRVDEILSQVHQTGLDSLSPEDRSLLRRVSARYRSRTR